MPPTLPPPQPAPALLRLAAAIARDRNYELECLQIIIVPRNSSPSESAVRTTKSRRLLQQAERIVRNWNLPVHTQIRVAHDVPNAILETIRERHIDLILMGWQGELSTKERIFGDVVDTVIRQAGCEVVLVKWSEKLLAKRKKNEFSATFSGRKYASVEWELNPKKVDGADNPALARSSDSSATPETELSPPNADIPGPELGLHTLMGLTRWLVALRGGDREDRGL